jgi:hypothetical protein
MSTAAGAHPQDLLSMHAFRTGPVLVPSGFALLAASCLPVTAGAVAQDGAIRLRDHRDIASSLANDLAVEDGMAYITTLDGLEIFDLADPDAPRPVTRFDCGPGFRVTVAGGHAFLVQGGTDGVLIVDIRNPRDCRIVGRHRTYATYADVVARNGTLYLAARNHGLEIVDVTDPPSPATTRTLFEPGQYSGGWMGYSCVDLSGYHAFIGQSGLGVTIVDVSDPAAPVKVAVVERSGHIGDIHVESGIMALAASQEVSSWDLSDLRNPVMISSVDAFVMPSRIARTGDTLAIHDDRYVILDIADPRSPEIAGALAEYTHALVFHAGHLYSTIKGLEAYESDLW